MRRARPSRPRRGRSEGGESLGVFGTPLTSPQNALVKRAASLRQRKFRDREGAFLAEGADLVAAGLAAGCRPQVIFLRDEVADEFGARLGLAAGPGASCAPGARDAAMPAAVGSAPALAGEAGSSRAGAAPPPAVFPVSERVAAHIATLETPPDAMAVFPLPERRPLSSLTGVAAGPADLLVVYADGIQDPGNLGTLLRAAVAFGAAALLTAPGAADLYGPKTVRASMGALFGLPLYADVQLCDALAQLPAAEVYGLCAHGGAPLDAAELRRPAVLAVGAERAGLSDATLACVTRLVTIPLAPAAAGAVESLNAGVAGAIALYELSRRPAGGAPEDPSRRPAAQEG